MKKIILFLCLFLTACGSDSLVEEPSSPPSSPAANPGITSTHQDLQIVRRGQNTPLQNLRLHPGDRVFLETRSQGLSGDVEWFSPHSYYATFEAPGLLQVHHLGHFLIGAIQNGFGHFIEVEVVEDDGSETTLPDVPHECVPITCESKGYNCGETSDGCGEILNCGTCANPGETCGGAGHSNICGVSTEMPPPEMPGCTPQRCAANVTCGRMDDGCGAMMNCGECERVGLACGALGTANRCEAIPPPPSRSSDRFIDSIASFMHGSGDPFGETRLVFGTPHGAAPLGGGDVLSLGLHGEIVLQFDTPILNGSGPDFIVYENAFMGWVELGEVSVSQDGMRFATFPCSMTPPDYVGCAGVHPVFPLPPMPEGGYTPAQLLAIGGDPFDLETVGLSWARFIRIRDLATQPGFGASGFDLDAIGILNQ